MNKAWWQSRTVWSTLASIAAAVATLPPHFGWREVALRVSVALAALGSTYARSAGINAAAAVSGTPPAGVEAQCAERVP